MRKLWRRVYFWAHRRELERELADEMAAHREMMPEDRRRHFGSAAKIQEDAREVWSWTWLGGLWQDLCYGARVLRRAPGFALGAAVVLGLGVGVNLVEFQILDAMIFHRLEVRDPGSVLQFTRNSRQGRRLGFPHGAVELYQTESQSFEWLISEDVGASVAIDGGPPQRAALVSPNYFTALGVVAALGRLPDAADSQPGAEPAVALAYDYWRTQFGAEPEVVGKLVRMNNQPARIVGVAPFTFPRSLLGRRAEVWMPLSTRPVAMPGAPPLEQDFVRAGEALFGKLKPGVSRAAGDGELTSLTRELARQQPRAFRDDERLESELVQQSVMQTVRRQPAIAIFLVMMLLVLLSACANLGNMLLARGMARQREIGIRVSIGASRMRVLRQLMTENLLLAMLGAGVGLGFAAVATRVLLNALDAFTMKLRFGWPILAAALVLTMISAAAFGLPAAMRTLRANPRMRLGRGLIGVQVAVSCLLLIASSVLVHNGIASAAVDLAFDFQHMVVVAPQFYGQNASAAAAAQKLDALSERLSAVPGVTGVTRAKYPPLNGDQSVETVPGAPRIHRNAVAASYFQVMQLRMARGRTFAAGEPDTAVVSESAARSLWPGLDALGKMLRLGGLDRQVVGVVADSGANLLVDADSVEAYSPIGGENAAGSVLIVHARGELGPVMRALGASVAPVHDAVSVIPMSASRDTVLQSYRRMTTLIGSIGVVASVLAAAGMFAMVAFTVSQRTRELGIRMAIGARPGQILQVLFRQSAKATAIGMGAGVVLALALGRLVRSQVPLRSQDPVDLVGFVAGLAAFVVLAVAAALSPSLRALRIDPARTLREE